MVFTRPSRSGTDGLQSSNSFALLISGRLCRGEHCDLRPRLYDFDLAIFAGNSPVPNSGKTEFSL
jgi:hypothetical protein